MGRRLAARLVIISLLLAALLAFGTPAGAATLPYHVHLSWRNDPHTTASVTWHTDDVPGDYSPRVTFGTSPGNYTGTAVGASYTYPGASVEIHTVELSGLSPDTGYYYKCGSSAYGWSPEYSFCTPPQKRKGFRFCAYGDSRNGLWPFESGDNSNFEVWGDMVNRVLAERPLLNVFTGDNIQDGTNEEKWNLWFDKFQVASPFSVFMGCHGNHEKYADAYFGRFAFPGDEKTYSFDVSNVHFTCLDTGLNDSEPALLQQQVSWLENDLAAATARGVDWKVAFFHRPPYATGSHGNAADVIEKWVPIFDKYKVDMVFNGHNHYYERSYPMRGGSVADTNGSYYKNPAGTIYATAGCAGAPLADIGSATWVARNAKEYNFCTVDVQPDRSMRVRAKKRDGSSLEEFTVAKDNTPILTAVNPSSGRPGDVITLAGDRFGVQQGSSRVTFGGVAASGYPNWDDQELKVEVPTGISGQVDVKVTTSGGTSNALHFNVLEPVQTQPVSSIPSSWYFAEGTCRPGFEPYICMQNPGDKEASVRITFMKGDGTTKDQRVKVKARSRYTVRVKDTLGEGDDPSHDFSAKVETTNGAGIIAERPMYFNYSGKWTGGHDVIGATGASKVWYFAEGCTREYPDANFHTWLCLQNPGGKEVGVKITYMPASGGNSVREVKVPARSRRTECANWNPGPGRDLSAKVEASGKVVCERPMYFDYGGKWTGGHTVVGALSSAKAFYFAEGTCRPGFEPYICMQNPGDKEASVRITFMKGDGTTKDQRVKVKARSRYTVRVEDTLGEGDDPSHDFSAKVETTNGAGIIAERPMYFNYSGKWTGGHTVVGALYSAKAFYFAEGTCRPGFEPYICMQNPGDKEASVRITFMKGDGTTKDQRVKVKARSRYTVRVKDTLGEGDDPSHDFSAKVETTNDTGIIAERPMYFNYGGKWTGGHCVVGYAPRQ